MKRHSLIKVIMGKEVVVYSGTQKSHMTRMLGYLTKKGYKVRIETEKEDRIISFIRKNNLLRRNRRAIS